MTRELKPRGPFWRYKGRIAALVAALILTALWGWGAERDRQLEIEATEQRLTALAHAAEYQIDGSLRSMVGLMEEAANRIDPAAGLDPALERWFSVRLVDYPEIRNLVVVDGNGHVVAVIARPGQVLPGHAEDLSDRPYFIDARDQFPQRMVLLPEPVTSRFSQQASIPLSHSIVGKNGQFAGLVVAGVNPVVFRDQLNAVVTDMEGGASLFRRDGVYYARVPRHEEYFGKTVAASPMFPLIGSATAGVVRFTSMVNGKDKISAYRTLAHYPLVVAVAETTDRALLHWRAQVAEKGAALVAVVTLLLVLAWRYDVRAQANRVLTRQLQTSHDQLERQVSERTAHLAASNAELEQFAYVASHDLQEPLRTISSFLQLLSRRYGGQLDAEADEYIGFAVDGAQRMSALINDLLAFSRVGRDGIAPEPCDAELVAHTALGSLRSAVAAADALVAIRPLPAVWCRPSELQSLFQNLIGNGVKYRDPARRPEITVSARPEANGMVCFTIADNGIGIEPQYHERIFGIFQRLHPRTLYDGTGIGLALCRKIVEHHGGRIWLDSTPGQGTTVSFTLKGA